MERHGWYAAKSASGFRRHSDVSDFATRRSDRLRAALHAYQVSYLSVDEHVTFSLIFPIRRALFVFRQPLLSAVSNIFILPFQRSVWLAIGVFLLLVLGLLWLSSGWEYHRETSKSGSTLAYRHRLNQPRQTVSDNLMVVLAAAAQQGKYTVDRRDGGNIDG